MSPESAGRVGDGFNDAGNKGIRDAIYGKYVSSGAVGARPRSIGDFTPRIPSFRQLVRRHFPSDKSCRVLDLGCGQGSLLYVAAQEGYRNLSGVDGSAEQVAVAHALGITEVRQADLFSHIREQAPAAFDVVITYDVIEHLTKGEVLALAGEVRRVLRADGRWIIHVPNGESPFVGRIRYGDMTHELAFTRFSVSALLKACDFATVQCFEDVPVPHGIKSAVRFVLWKLMRLPMALWITVETGENGLDCIFSQNLVAVARRDGAPAP
jgi:SAM-dependent methyltransferase